MPKNSIQFQPGMSLATFVSRYGTEAQCRSVVARWRWPSGFRCPQCDYPGHCALSRRAVYQCHRCRRQTSLTSGTLFAASKLPLRTWFLGLYLLTQSKVGISALALKRALGVSYNTAWLVKQKLMQAMKERDDRTRLSGWIQVDDAVWGGEHRGGKCGRNAPGKTPFIAAVACNERGHPLQMRLSRIDNVRHVTVAGWARRHLAPDATVVTDGLIGLRGVTHAGCAHHVEVTGGGADSAKNPHFHWVNTMLGNLKNSLRGTYRGMRAKHLPRYLAEFSYRFNRRFALQELVPRLAYASVHTPPLPYRLAKLAEDYG